MVKKRTRSLRRAERAARGRPENGFLRDKAVWSTRLHDYTRPLYAKKMSTCEDLAIESGLIELMKALLAAKEEMHYLALAERMEDLRPTDKDGANLSELKRKCEEACKAYDATLKPMFKERKRLRDIVHAWPEYVAASQTCKKAREAYEMACKVCAENKKFYRCNLDEFNQRNKNAGGELGMPMLLVRESQYVAGLKADCDALARKVREADEAFKAYKEFIKYSHVARDMEEAMEDAAESE
jgi:hypothetical protein